MADKPKFETADLSAENVAQIADLFPGVVVEERVNFGLLRSLLGDEVFGEHISEATIREIAGRKPFRAEFCDSSFSSSPEKINVFEIFKLLAPNTSVRVI